MSHKQLAQSNLEASLTGIGKVTQLYLFTLLNPKFPIGLRVATYRKRLLLAPQIT